MNDQHHDSTPVETNTEFDLVAFIEADIYFSATVNEGASRILEGFARMEDAGEVFDEEERALMAKMASIEQDTSDRMYEQHVVLELVKRSRRSEAAS